MRRIRCRVVPCRRALRGCRVRLRALGIGGARISDAPRAVHVPPVRDRGVV